MPPTTARRARGSTYSTRVNADTSRPRYRAAAGPSPAAWRGSGSRNRNRFEVRLASRTGLPGGMAA